MKMNFSSCPGSWRMLLVAAEVAAALFASGCEEAPDHCEGYPRACIGVTVESGPENVRRLSVTVRDGIESNTSTALTPKKQAKAPLVYPLRFAVQFAEFDNLYRGEVSLMIKGFNEDLDVLGVASAVVHIEAHEKKSISVLLDQPPSPPPDQLDMSPALPAQPGLPDMP